MVRKGRLASFRKPGHGKNPAGTGASPARLGSLGGPLHGALPPRLASRLKPSVATGRLAALVTAKPKAVMPTLSFLNQHLDPMMRSLLHTSGARSRKDRRHSKTAQTTPTKKRRKSSMSLLRAASRARCRARAKPATVAVTRRKSLSLASRTDVVPRSRPELILPVQLPILTKFSSSPPSCHSSPTSPAHHSPATHRPLHTPAWSPPTSRPPFPTRPPDSPPSLLPYPSQPPPLSPSLPPLPRPLSPLKSLSPSALQPSDPRSRCVSLSPPSSISPTSSGCRPACPKPSQPSVTRPSVVVKREVPTRAAMGLHLRQARRQRLRTGDPIDTAPVFDPTFDEEELLLLQLPSHLPLKPSRVNNSRVLELAHNGNTSRVFSACSNHALGTIPAGCLGQLLVLKSGRMQLRIGCNTNKTGSAAADFITLDVGGSAAPHLQSLVAVRPTTRLTGKERSPKEHTSTRTMRTPSNSNSKLTAETTAVSKSKCLSSNSSSSSPTASPSAATTRGILNLPDHDTTSTSSSSPSTKSGSSESSTNCPSSIPTAVNLSVQSPNLDNSTLFGNAFQLGYVQRELVCSLADD